MPYGSAWPPNVTPEQNNADDDEDEILVRNLEKRP
jgi:hypothetical protein